VALSANFWNKLSAVSASTSASAAPNTPQFGGTGGGTFDDSKEENVDRTIVAIHIRCGSRVDAVGIVFEGESVPKNFHGGTGGHLEVFSLLSDEKIIRIEGRSGSRLDQLCFVTNKRKSAVYGGDGGNSFLMDGQGHPLKYFSGRSGSAVDALQAHWCNYVIDISAQSIPSEMKGGTGGNAFDDSLQVDVSKRITSIHIRSGNSVDSIQVIYDSASPRAHGGTGGGDYTFDLGPDESIIRIEGRSGSRIDRLQFFTNQGRVSDLFGGTGGDPFILDGDGKVLKYIEGRSGSRLDALRVNWWPIAPSAYKTTDVKYSISEGQILSAPPEAVGTITLTNRSSVQQNSSQNTSVSVAESSSWTNKVGAKVGVKTSISTGIPFLVDGKVEISVEASYEYSWGTTKTTTRVIGQTVSASIPAGKQMKVNFVAQRATLDVPYSATFVTEFTNGTKKSEYITGVYKGVSVTGLSVEYGQDEPVS